MDSIYSFIHLFYSLIFTGDYSLVRGTLLYALYRNLGIKLADIAKDKLVDLRRNFNCWVSKPLPDDKPYDRLVCFERMNRNETLPDQISGLFRAMMPIFNNVETSVITPLLSAGGQVGFLFYTFSLFSLSISKYT